MSSTATIKHTFLPSSSSSSKRIHVSQISRNFVISNPIAAFAKFFHKGISFSTPRLKLVKCNSVSEENNGNRNLKDALSSLVGEQVEELLNREENRDLLDGLEKASMRVEIAKRQLAEIEEQEIELKRFKDYINKLEDRASEIAECQREIMEARAMVEDAERSLLQSNNEDAITDGENEGLNKDEDRLESIKAASISALVGTLAGLPIFLTQVTDTSQLVLPVATTLISCALFGVTYRHTIRRDLDDIHLKSGAAAAFGLVKGLATLDGGRPLEPSTESFMSHAFDGAVYISENLYIFISAAVALDYCFKMRLLSPFPIRRSISGVIQK